MRLPIEVSEAVIDQAGDNPRSLRNLSLTCTAFLPRSWYHLFKSIKIRTVEQMESSREFLDAHPWLPPLVQKVTLSCDPPPKYTKQNLRVLDVVPVHLLTRLPNLRSWSMETTSESSEASLSLHRSALLPYRIYGNAIQTLDLCRVEFYRLSDFTGLVSAFASIRTLTCSGIDLRQEEPDTSLLLGGTGMVVRPLRVSTLTIAHVDIRAAEYMLTRSGAILSSLILSVHSDWERLEKSISWLSGLSSLTLTLWPAYSGGGHFSSCIRSATRILQSVERGRLTDVRVEFNIRAIADLGHYLSGPDAPLEDCELLQQALLTFPNASIVVHDTLESDQRAERADQRAGRADLWSPIIECAFSMVRERERLFLNFKTSSGPGSLDPLGHELTVTSLVISHDSRYVITASADDTIIVWDTSSGTILQEWLAHQGGVRALALSPDSRRLVSAGGYRTLIVWAIGDGVHKIAELEGHTGALMACAWSPDGALIASASQDRTVRVWDAHTFQQCDLFLYPHQELQKLQFSPDARHLAWISNEDCCIWRPLRLPREQPRRLALHWHPVSDGLIQFPRIHALSFDPQSSRIATAHGHFDRAHNIHVVRIWDVATGTALAVLSGHSSSVMGVSFSPDGTSLLSFSTDGSVRIWDAYSGQQMALVEDTTKSGIPQACYSPDGEFITVGMRTGEGLLQLWRTDDWSCAAIFDEHFSWDKFVEVRQIVFSPNGEFLASGDSKGIVHIRRLSDSIKY